MNAKRKTAPIEAIESSRKAVATILRGTARSITQGDYKSAARKIEVAAAALNDLTHLESQLA